MSQDKFQSPKPTFQPTSNTAAVEAIVAPKRQMTEKKFAISKLSGRATAAGFIAAHRAFLNQRDFLSPTLQAFDNQEQSAELTLLQLQSALLDHVMQLELELQEERLNKKVVKAEKKGRPTEGKAKRVKRYTCTLMVMGEDGTPQEATTWQVDDYGTAMRSVDLRLFHREDSLYAKICNNYDLPVITQVPRQDAIARMLRSKKGPAAHVRGRSTRTLGWQPHVKQTRVTGPWSHR